MPLWENGGYFVLRPEIFDHIPENGDLVADGCAAAGQARAGCWPTRYRGFWQPADTVKERTALEAAYQGGDPPVDALGRRSAAERTRLQATIAAMHDDQHER